MVINGLCSFTHRYLESVSGGNMPIKVFKPTSPGRRDMSGQTFEEITHTSPERSLTRGLRKRADVISAARSPFVIVVVVTNAVIVRLILSGEISLKFRRVSLRLNMIRTGQRGLLCWCMLTARSGTLLPRWGCALGISVSSGPTAEIRPGNALPLKNIPVGYPGS